jgi:ribonuclease VapC
METGNFQLVGIGAREFEIAVDAYAQCGRGRRPAALNIGDCFAYLCAKANRAKLLFKGEDFTKIDITPCRLNGGQWFAHARHNWHCPG